MKNDNRKQYTFKVRVDEKAYELLKAYDYFFQKNIQQMLEDDAKELLKWLRLRG